MEEREQQTASQQQRNGWLFGILVALVLVLGTGSTLYATQHWWLPPLASVQGAAVDQLFNGLMILIGVVFIGVHAVLAYFIVKHTDRGQSALFWHENNRLELTWTIVPGIILVVLMVLTVSNWTTAGAVPAGAGANNVTVEVTARQFGWYVRYPGEDGQFGRIDRALIDNENPLGIAADDPAGQDDIVTLNQLALPVAQPAHVLIESQDVIHSFFVPNFRVKQDAVPGRTTDVQFTPSETGTYEIACAELCGTGHYAMRGEVEVLSAEAFQNWLQEQAQSGGE